LLVVVIVENLAASSFIKIVWNQKLQIMEFVVSEQECTRESGRFREGIYVNEMNRETSQINRITRK
jgi:hypothetical protein